jgi:hypothetical protein
MNTQKTLSKLYCNRIYLGNNKWLVFERQQRESYYENDIINVRAVDKDVDSSMLLGTYKDGKWTSPLSYNLNLMWYYFKLYKTIVKIIMKDLQTPVDEGTKYNVYWDCFVRRLRLKAYKIIRKITR